MHVCVFMCSRPHIHLSGRQGDAADQNLRARQKKKMKKQFASRRAPPGQPVPNPYDESDEDTLEGGEGDSEEDGSTEGDEEPGDNLPRVKDIAQVRLFFDFSCICFCLVCFQHSFLPQVPGDRHAQSATRMGYLDTVISFLFVCVIDPQFFALTNYMMVGEQAGAPFEEGPQLRPQLRPNYGH